MVIKVMTSFLRGAAEHASDCPRGLGFDFIRLVDLSPARLNAIPAECWPDGLRARVDAEIKRLADEAAEKAFEDSLGPDLLPHYHRRRWAYRQQNEPAPGNDVLKREAEQSLAEAQAALKAKQEASMKAFKEQYGERERRLEKYGLPREDAVF